MEIGHLADWLNQSALQATFEHEEATRRINQASFACTFPPKKVFKFPCFTLEFIYEYQTKFDKNKAHVDFKQMAHLIYHESQPPEVLLNDITRLRNFIALGLGHPIYIGPMKARSSKILKKLGEKDVSVAIVPHIRADSLSDNEKLIYQKDMLFEFTDIEPSFTDIYSQWISRSADLEPTIQSYFAALYTDELYSIDRFLSLAQAIESYHRRAFSGSYLSKSDFQRLKQALIEAIPSDLPNEVIAASQGKIQFFNEYSQRTRYNDLIAILKTEYGETVSRHIEDSDEFIKLVIDTRNYYIHFDPKSKGKSAEGLGLMILIEKLLFLLEVVFMRELGFKPENVAELIDRTEKYQFLRNYRSWNAC